MFKTIRHLNTEEIDTLKLNIITELELLRCYKELWTDAVDKEKEVGAEEYKGDVDYLTIYEFEEALNH